MTPEELTQFVNIQQTVLTRHDAEMAEIRAVLNQVAHQQETNTQQIELNRQDITQLTASIQELRNLVADYIQSRNQP